MNKDLNKIKMKNYKALSKYITNNYIKDDFLAFEDYLEFSLKIHACQEIVLSEDLETLEKEIKYENIIPREKLKFMRKRSLDDIIKEQAETFSESLLRLIDISNLKDSEVYRRANIDRRLFSKIRSDKNYKPSKNTALAFSIALHLDLDKTLDFIGKAGFTLSLSSKFDLIIRYFIEEQDFNIFTINEALKVFEQPILSF
ncbi:MAG: hypothetical protein FWE36_08045 [Erysipelotrichales bacterium]|nr:hypothetical protein [Erysipelotrichales bacterium]